MSAQAGDSCVTVRCRHCGSAEGVRCVNPATGKTLTKFPCHPIRTFDRDAQWRAA